MRPLVAVAWTVLAVAALGHGGAVEWAGASTALVAGSVRDDLLGRFRVETGEHDHGLPHTWRSLY